MSGEVTLFLCGDVMTGRGVDQVLPYPGDPTLWEPSVRDARTYVQLAESVSGPVPRPVDPAWPWGEALPLLERFAPEARVINLETAVTRSDDIAAKPVTYRMNPENVVCLQAARPDVCVLANNHVLDYGRAGLTETLTTLSAAGLRTVGAGQDAGAARAPAVVPLPGGGRLLVAAVGFPSSGIPADWAAEQARSGVAYAPEPTESVAAELAESLAVVRRPGDLAVVSVHWGSNWGYAVPQAHRRFAHALVAHGIDLVHGHSSHHPRPIEVHGDRLVLYGCGDFVDDYEGISGYEHYRPDLRLAYLPTLHRATGALTGLRIGVLRARRLHLDRAADDDVEWARDVLARISAPLAGVVECEDDGTLLLRRVAPDDVRL